MSIVTIFNNKKKKKKNNKQNLYCALVFVLFFPVDGFPIYKRCKKYYP